MAEAEGSSISHRDFSDWSNGLGLRSHWYARCYVDVRMVFSRRRIARSLNGRFGW